nr:transposase (putative), gypsy type [Tanacetum cinerariifolium]
MEKLNGNRTLIRRYPEAFLCLVGLSHSFVDVDSRPTLLGPDDDDMGLLDFVKSADPFKVKVRKRTLDEENTGKKKRKVVFNDGTPPMKRARASDVVSSEPKPTTNDKSLAVIQKLISQNGQLDAPSRSVAPHAEEFVSSFCTPTPDRDYQDESTSADGKNVSSPVSDVQTKVEDEVGVEAMAVANEAGTSFVLGNETGASSFALGARSSDDDFFEEKFKGKFTESFAVVQQRDAEIVKLRLEKAESEAAEVSVFCCQVSSLKAAIAAKAEELASLSVENAELLERVSSLESDRKRLEEKDVRGSDLDARLFELCYQSYKSVEYQNALAKVISLAIDQGIQQGLEVGVDHGKAKRELSLATTYDLGVKAKYKKAVGELEHISFSFLDRIESYKDAPLDHIMASLYLEGFPNVKDETPEFRRLQPVLEQRYRQGSSPGLVVMEVATSGPDDHSLVTTVTPLDTLVITDCQISSLAILENIVSTAEPHDDLFDATVLDKHVDS